MWENDKGIKPGIYLHIVQDPGVYNTSMCSYVEIRRK